MLRRYSSRTLSNITKKFNRNRFDGYYRRSMRLSHTVTFNNKISMSLTPYRYISSHLTLYSVGKTSRKQSSTVRRTNTLPREERYSCEPCHRYITVTFPYNINLLATEFYI
jgi:hypothetical protein